MLVFVLTSCDSSGEAEVLSGWINAAFVGDVDGAAEFLADDVEWIGLGQHWAIFYQGDFDNPGTALGGLGGSDDCDGDFRFF